jgi:DNA-binding transcriptional LysR family regulator
MRRPGDVDLDLRKLRYFVAVADHESFRGAADSVLVAQPALSRQIRSLEHELGVRLFVRTSRGVALTRPGRELLDEARALLQASSTLVRRAQQSGGCTERLTIGFRLGVGIAALTKEFQSHQPLIAVHVMLTCDQDQTQVVRDGRVDIGFVRSPFVASDLAVLPLYSEPTVLAVPLDHPLASTPGVAVGPRDLSTLQLLQAPSTPPRALEPQGRRVAGTGGGTELVELLEEVAGGHGTLLVPASVALCYQRPGVAYLATRTAASSDVSLVYRAADDRPSVREFARTARFAYATPGSARTPA